MYKVSIFLDLSFVVNDFLVLYSSYLVTLIYMIKEYGTNLYKFYFEKKRNILKLQINNFVNIYIFFLLLLLQCVQSSPSPSLCSLDSHLKSSL